MTEYRVGFEVVEREVRKKSFGVLSVVDSKLRPHSTGILYGVSPPQSKFAFYIMVGSRYAKVRHIKRNPNVSLVVTFPHYYIRFAPASYAMFRGVADFVPIEDKDVQWAFRQSRILRMNIDSTPIEYDVAVIRIQPEPTVFCCGLGIGLLELRRSHETGSYKVKIPGHRL
ncbi:MAG: pyridoxamine 5'-phosphate oxidase family protein [Candidatus Thorarchaeota archaeon]|nr:MAG: pyridoxamine 5'-phosphate oxidase family protein [Candidatus Thorarchaeota archaeon]